MSLSDPIGDMIARIKNAQSRNHKKVELPSSNFKVKIVKTLNIIPIIQNLATILLSWIPFIWKWWCKKERPTDDNST